MEHDDSDDNDDVQARFASSEESSACSSVLSSLESVESNTSEGESNTSEGGNKIYKNTNEDQLLKTQVKVGDVTFTHQKKTISGCDCCQVM